MIGLLDSNNDSKLTYDELKEAVAAGILADELPYTMDGYDTSEYYHKKFSDPETGLCGTTCVENVMKNMLQDLGYLRDDWNETLSGIVDSVRNPHEWIEAEAEEEESGEEEKDKKDEEEKEEKDEKDDEDDEE